MLSKSIRTAALYFSKRTRKRMLSENLEGLAGAIRYTDYYGRPRAMILDGYVGVDYADEDLDLEEVTCDNPYRPETFREILGPDPKGNPIKTHLPTLEKLRAATRQAKIDHPVIGKGKNAVKPVFLVRIESGHYFSAANLQTFEDIIGYRADMLCDTVDHPWRPVRYYSEENGFEDEIKAIVLPVRYTPNDNTFVILDMTAE